ncbi:hypothetical protein GS597_10890 [Synechococcales cyanobacterium C]|uniref:Uncharacterized protein n=1 Tax=Petrachloros mirabilis ULC683 TaxID=2781853 RepID=A0A8K1ZXC1_9CYAN|nr:hypothetical protein [Petrachloros mirabilis]NCJ07005.1 hypothetical protein [Petrachloros mirabilis ULC683]
MFGTYQHSQLRLETNASAQQLAAALTQTDQLRQWLWPQRLSQGLPQHLTPGLQFTSWTGPVAVQHQVEQLVPNGIRLTLSQGIDGFHEWSWGHGWVQSRLEGITLLPLNLGQTFTLLRLQAFLRQS